MNSSSGRITFKISSTGVPSAIRTVADDMIGESSEPCFNLNAQRVGKDFKGIVVRDGKKYMQK